MSPQSLVFESQLAVHLSDPLGLDRPLTEARAERLDPLREPCFIAYPLDGETFGHRYLFRQRREVHRHPDVVAAVLEAVGDEPLAEIGRPHRWPDVPGTRNTVRLHTFLGGFYLCVRL